MLGQQLLEFTLVVRTRSADVAAQNPTQDPIQTPQGLLSCTMLCLLLFGGRLLERERGVRGLQVIVRHRSCHVLEKLQLPFITNVYISSDVPL